MRGVYSKRGQVWVETVIYTLIGLAIIGLVLAGAMPKINEKKDTILIEQSIESLRAINDVIYRVQKATGAKGKFSLSIKRGSFVMNMEEDTLSWNLESSFPYSEIGYSQMVSGFNLTTSGKEKPYDILIIKGYGGLDLRYNGVNTGTKQLDAAPTSYDISISNEGREDGIIIINFIEN